MAKNLEANAYSIFAGSYERFLFGHAYGANSSFAASPFTGEEEKEKKNAKFLCTIDAHSQSINQSPPPVRFSVAEDTTTEYERFT